MDTVQLEGGHLLPQDIVNPSQALARRAAKILKGERDKAGTELLSAVPLQPLEEDSPQGQQPAHRGQGVDLSGDLPLRGVDVELPVHQLLDYIYPEVPSQETLLLYKTTNLPHR